MAFSYAQTQLMGNITKDPELKYTPGGTAVLNFTVATNRRVKDDQVQGGWKDVPSFHRVKAFGKTAEWLANTIKKGDQVFVAGRPEERSWQKQDGTTAYMHEVVAETIVPAKKPRVQQTQQTINNDEPPIDEPIGSNQETVDLDDIPF